ncbi:ATP-binding protein [Pseudoalteromonas phenolica]|uniref:ATP-binding protein n=1 Tax=Pseudoalteromonas phenolica TaxID=161398 RepID=UPI001486250C|nr:ATP-binding protein [Pseudoalteromonas phenolica]
MNKTFLVVGISGVGKSTLCHAINVKFSVVEHIVASRLIKGSKNFNEAQQLLVNRINKLIKASKKRVFLIDGHLLIGENKVSISVLKKLKLDGIVYLLDSPDAIRTRRLKDETRERVIETAQDIEISMLKELEYSKLVSKKLSIPLSTLNLSKPNVMEEFIGLIKVEK